MRGVIYGDYLAPDPGCVKNAAVWEEIASSEDAPGAAEEALQRAK